MRIAADESADAWAVWALGDRMTYAESLLETVGSSRPTAAGRRDGPGPRGTKAIERRLSMIMRQKLERRMTWPALAAYLLTGLLVLPAAPDRAGAQVPQAPAPEVKPPPAALPDTPPAEPVPAEKAEKPSLPAEPAPAAPAAKGAKPAKALAPAPADLPGEVNPSTGFGLRSETWEFKYPEGGPFEFRGVDGGASRCS